MLNHKDGTGFVSGLKSCVSQSAAGPGPQLRRLCVLFQMRHPGPQAPVQVLALFFSYFSI